MRQVSIQMVQLEHVITAPAYQRPLDASRVLKMVNNIDVRMFGVPELSHRDGDYFAMDGQHRVESAKLAGWGEAVCRVHEGLSYEEEVSLYRRLNKDRQQLPRIDDFKAAVEQGDPDMLALKAMVEAAGYQISRGKGPGRIAAVAQLVEMYRTNESLITDALLVCSRAWVEFMDSKTSLTAEQIGGVHLVLHRHPEVDRDRLVTTLRKHTPVWWTASADVATNSRNRAVRMAKQIRSEYNKSLRRADRRLVWED